MAHISFFKTRQTISELLHITRPKTFRSLWTPTDFSKNSGNSRPLWYPKASKSSKSEAKTNSTKAICRKQNTITSTLSCVPARAGNRKYRATTLRWKANPTQQHNRQKPTQCGFTVSSNKAGKKFLLGFFHGKTFSTRLCRKE